MDLDPQTLDTIRALLMHLCAHPRRSDTAEGIARWWLPTTADDPQALAQALQWLIARNLIEERLTRGMPVSYRRKAGTAELAAALQALPPATP